MEAQPRVKSVSAEFQNSNVILGISLKFWTGNEPKKKPSAISDG